MGTLGQGMAFGAGSEVAHQAVRSLMGGGSSSSGHHDAAPAPAAAPLPPAPQMAAPTFSAKDTCALPQQDLFKCLQASNSDAAACDFYFAALKQCQEGAKQDAQF